MPIYGPPRLKRRRIGYGRRNILMAARRSAGGRLMRQLGVPAVSHTFARPGTRILITQQSPSGTWQCNGGGSVPGGTLPNGGIAFGTAGAGDLMGTSNVAFGQMFAFTLLSQYSDLATLYDNFRIKSVKLRIDLSFNTNTGIGASGASSTNLVANSMPMLHYAVDQDDASAPGSTQEVLAYSKSRSVRLGDKPVYINLVPRAQGGVVSAANPGSGATAAVGTMLPLSTWLDSQNAQSVPHYGVKYFLENMPTNTGTGLNWAMYITPVYILECKNVN